MPPTSHEIHLMNVLGPMLGAAAFIAVMSAIREPARQRFNAVFAGGAGAAYLNGGLGLWEFAYVLLAVWVAYLGLREYRFIALAWLLHTAWDVVHHLYGNPIWHWAPLSSFGCAVMDALIAVWFWKGAPSLFSLAARGPRPASAS